MVDLPEAERPVNQTVAPCCLRNLLRSVRVRPACQVMLLGGVSLSTCGDSRGFQVGNRVTTVSQVLTSTFCYVVWEN